MYRFTIDNHEELSEGILRTLKEQYDHISLQTTIPDEIDNSVHEIRKSLKRIRAILRLIRYDIGEERFIIENLRFRNMARQISRLRDLSVIIKYFADNFESGELIIDENNSINFVHHLNNLRETELKRIVETQTFESIKEQMEIAHSDLNNYDLNNLGPHTIEEGILYVYNQCLKKIRETQLKLDNIPIHELRKRVKYLLNQMILIKDVWPEFFNTYSNSLKHASDLLGDDHNLLEITDLVKNTPSEILSEENKTIVVKRLDSERNHIHEELWPLLGKLFTEDPKSFIKRIKSYWLIGREQKY